MFQKKLYTENNKNKKKAKRTHTHKHRIGSLRDVLLTRTEKIFKTHYFDHITVYTLTKKRKRIQVTVLSYNISFPYQSANIITILKKIKTKHYEKKRFSSPMSR